MKWTRSPYWWILLVLAASRLVYAGLGVSFDAKPLDHFFQFLDPELLRHKLLESVYYLHTQPPLLNLFAGVILKLFPVAYSAAFHVCFFAASAAASVSVLSLMRTMGCSIAIAFWVTAVFIISPGFVLFENLLIYEHPLLALGCVGAWLLGQAARKSPTSGSAWYIAGFFAILAIMALTRASYHLLLCVMITVAVWWFLKEHRRTIAIAGGFSLMAVIGLYAKNASLYGTFNGSTWMGFNMATITIGHLRPDELNAFVASGLISPVAKIPAPGSLAEYQPYIHTPPPTGIAVLDQPVDSTGRGNFNAMAYFEVREFYARDGKALLLHFPKCYMRSVVTAWFTYFLPSGDFPFFEENRVKIAAWDRAFNVVFFGQWKAAKTRKELRAVNQVSPASLILYTGTYLMLGLPALFLWGCCLLWRHPLDRPQKAVLAFILAQILFVTMLSNSLSSFENNRYRIPLDGFYAVLFGMALTSVVDWIRQRRSVAPAVAAALPANH